MTLKQTQRALMSLDWLEDGERRRKLMFSIGWFKKDLEKLGVDVERVLKTKTLNKASKDRINVLKEV